MCIFLPSLTTKASVFLLVLSMWPRMSWNSKQTSKACGANHNCSLCTTGPLGMIWIRHDANLAKSQLTVIKQLHHTETDTKMCVSWDTSVWISQPTRSLLSIIIMLDLLYSTISLLISPEQRLTLKTGTDACTESSLVSDTGVRDAERLGKEHSRS